MNDGLLVLVIAMFALIGTMIIIMIVAGIDDKPGGFFHAWSRRNRRPNRKRY